MTKAMYAATFGVSGTVMRTFYAESDEEAKKIAEDMQDDEDDEVYFDLETVDDVCLITGPTRLTRKETAK